MRVPNSTALPQTHPEYWNEEPVTRLSFSDNPTPGMFSLRGTSWFTSVPSQGLSVQISGSGLLLSSMGTEESPLPLVAADVTPAEAVDTIMDCYTKKGWFVDLRKESQKGSVEAVKEPASASSARSSLTPDDVGWMPDEEVSIPSGSNQYDCAPAGTCEAPRVKAVSSRVLRQEFREALKQRDACQVKVDGLALEIKANARREALQDLEEGGGGSPSKAPSVTLLMHDMPRDLSDALKERTAVTGNGVGDLNGVQAHPSRAELLDLVEKLTEANERLSAEPVSFSPTEQYLARKAGLKASSYVQDDHALSSAHRRNMQKHPAKERVRRMIDRVFPEDEDSAAQCAALRSALSSALQEGV